MRSTRPVTLSKLNQVMDGDAMPDRKVLKAAFSAGLLQKESLAEALNCNPSDVIRLWEHKNTRRIQDALRTCLPEVGTPAPQ